MLREEMPTFEEMEKEYPELDTEEMISYRIEKGLAFLKKKGIRVDFDTMDYLVDDVLWDLYEAEATESTIMGGRLLGYYSKKTRLEYEVIYDCDSFFPMEIKEWKMDDEYFDDFEDDDDL